MPSTFRRKCEICGKEIEGTSPTSATRNYFYHKNREHGRVKSKDETKVMDE